MDFTSILGWLSWLSWLSGLLHTGNCRSVNLVDKVSVSDGWRAGEKNEEDG